MKKEFNKINKIIGSLLQTNKANLKTYLALARQFGELYDKLFNELNLLSPTFIYCDRNVDYTNLNFFEAYFKFY